MPHLELVQILYIGTVDLQLIHSGSRWTHAQALTQLLKRVARALKMRFYGAVAREFRIQPPTPNCLA